MKIMRVLDKKIGNKTYHKYRINLPKEVVKETKLLDKDVRVKAEKDRIIIEKNKN